MHRKFLLGPILFGLLPVAVPAADDAATAAGHSGFFIGPLLETGYDFGGDTVATVIYSDGSRKDIKSGEGGLIMGGLHLRLYRESPFDLKATVGYKYASSPASNADINLSRITYELTPNVRLPHGIWLGAGLVHHSGISFSGGGVGPDLDFKDATGADFQLGWRSRTRRHADFGIAAIYTLIDYQDVRGGRYNADSFGLRFSFNFGWTAFGNPDPGPPPRRSPLGGVEIVPSQLPPLADPVPVAPLVQASPALMGGQSIRLTAPRTLRRQPRAEAPAGNTLAAGTVVVLDGQVGEFWFVRTATTVGWLRPEELR